MKKVLALLAALLFSAHAQAQSYPSPTFNNVTIVGGLFFNDCSGVVVGNASAAVTCQSTLDASLLPIGASGATIPLLSTANTWGALQTFGAFWWTGHPAGSGSAPALSSCGTSPALSTGANDSHGAITTGTGSPSSCTLTFASVFTNTPDCIVMSHANVTLNAVTPDLSTLVFTFPGTSSAKFTYHCFGK